MHVLRPKDQCHIHVFTANVYVTHACITAEGSVSHTCVTTKGYMYDSQWFSSAWTVILKVIYIVVWLS